MITIYDPGTTLTSVQAQTLTAKAAAYPFDLRVFIASGSSSRAAFEQQVDDAVTPGSRIVSIGVDPTHHFSHVHASGALGLPSGPVVASAGNAFFKQGNLVEGIDAIAAKANDLQAQTRMVTSQTGMPIVIHEHRTPDGVYWALGGLSGVVLAVALWAWWRSKKRDDAVLAERAALAEEAAELRARNLEEQDFTERLRARRSQPSPGSAHRGAFLPTSALRAVPAGYSPQAIQSMSVAAPPPVIINSSGSSNNGALDVMLGMELERSMEREPYRAPIVEREVVVERDTSSSSAWGGSDDSSSSSSFDTSGDSSSSSDSGGGSDSSGGSDS